MTKEAVFIKSMLVFCVGYMHFYKMKFCLFLKMYSVSVLYANQQEMRDVPKLSHTYYKFILRETFWCSSVACSSQYVPFILFICGALKFCDVNTVQIFWIYRNIKVHYWYNISKIEEWITLPLFPQLSENDRNICCTIMRSNTIPFVTVGKPFFWKLVSSNSAL
jgi:hypothetical protein